MPEKSTTTQINKDGQPRKKPGPKPGTKRKRTGKRGPKPKPVKHASATQLLPRVHQHVRITGTKHQHLGTLVLAEEGFDFFPTASKRTQARFLAWDELGEILDGVAQVRGG